MVVAADVLLLLLLLLLPLVMVPLVPVLVAHHSTQKPEMERQSLVQTQTYYVFSPTVYLRISTSNTIDTAGNTRNGNVSAALVPGSNARDLGPFRQISWEMAWGRSSRQWTKIL